MVCVQGAAVRLLLHGQCRPIFYAFNIDSSRIETKSIVEVQALDFDGDGALDALVVTEQSHVYTVCVYWGQMDEGVWSVPGEGPLPDGTP